MSKELPYFKFEPAEWLIGDISQLSYEHQGVFIQICIYYWMKNCEVSKQMLSKRLANAKQIILDELISENIIKIDENENIEISFLKEQFNKFLQISSKRSISGSQGAVVKQANAKQMPSKCQANANILEEIRGDKIREDKPIKEKIDFSFVNPEYKIIISDWFEYKKARKQEYKNQKSAEAFYKSLLKLSNNNPETAKKIIENSMANNWAGIFELKQTKIEKNGYDYLRSDFD